MNITPRALQRIRLMKPLLSRATACLLMGCSLTAQAQLVDGGFDMNLLTTLNTVIGGPSFVYGVWGQESATLSTGVGPNQPSTPFSMLSMTIGNSGVATQTAQAINVNVAPYMGLIASGNATFTYSALFNADAGGPIGGLSMSFFNGSSFSSLQTATPIIGNYPVDNIPGNWELHTITGAIPVGTMSLLAQVFYYNASLVNAAGFAQAGFVDDARLTIAVPEPGTWALMGLGGLLIGWRHRRLMKLGT